MVDQVIGGRYRLERRLGGGTMSEVWSATDLDLDRKVAVKLLATQANPARFEREARAAAALAHPNISTIYSYGDAGGRPFMVLEYLPGGSLEDRLADHRPLPDEEAMRIATEIAAGLAHAHVRGLVHRDLKPANVLFDRQGRAKVADFGIARIGEQSRLTEAGTVLGTAAYISPEQAAGEPATPASDVYAFGVIVFRMLTGRLPFESRDALELASMHRDRPPPAIAAFRRDAPVRLESVASAALAKSPLDRPRDGTAILAELAGAPRPVGEETAATQILSPTRERGRTAFVVAAAAILAGAGVALAVAVTFRGGTPAIATSSSVPTSRPTQPAPVPATPPTSAPETTTAETATTEPATTVEPTLPVTTLPTIAAASPTPPATAPLPSVTTAVLPPPPPPTAATTTSPPPVTTDTTPTGTATTTTTAGTAPATAPTQPG